MPALASPTMIGRARWFGAEFLVVVTGVLVALAFNAWWESRHDAARERAYLVQIRAELLRTEQELTEEIARDSVLFRRAAQLHATFFGGAPDQDPASFFSVDHSDPEPVLGTLRAIVATGDLQLVRDDSVRATLVWLGDRAVYYDQRFRKWENVIVGTFPDLIPPAFAAATVRWDQAGRPEAAGGGTWAEATAYIPPGVVRPRFTRTMAQLLEDPIAYRAAVTYMIGLRNHRRNQERMLEDVRAARAVLDGALD